MNIPIKVTAYIIGLVFNIFKLKINDNNPAIISGGIDAIAWAITFRAVATPCNIVLIAPEEAISFTTSTKALNTPLPASIRVEIISFKAIPRSWIVFLNSSSVFIASANPTVNRAIIALSSGCEETKPLIPDDSLPKLFVTPLIKSPITGK